MTKDPIGTKNDRSGEVSSPTESPDTPQRSISYQPCRPATRRRRKRGRPRTHWAKSSRYNRRRNEKRLREADIKKLKAADTFASRTRRRLETFATIRWGETAEGEANIQQRWSALLTKLRNWLAQRGPALCYIYVHENPPHAMPGFNTHLLVNVPARLRQKLASKLNEWLVGSRRAIDVQPRSTPGYAADDRLSYMLKGTDWATARKYRLRNRNGWDFDQGVVEFKRCGVSNNINAAAQAIWRLDNAQ